MEEKLIQYVWQLRLFPTDGLKTVDGEDVEVIDQGLLNTNSGPDFFNAKIKIGGTVWAGNVEIHDVASDWYNHGHDKDVAYDSVVLHVVRVSDERVRRTNGEVIPQLQIQIPADIEMLYDANKASKAWIPCAERIGYIDRFTMHSWLDSCLVQRMETKTSRLKNVLQTTDGDWASVMYVSIARALGFGTNSQAMEALACATPLKYILKHNDDIDHVAAMLLGQSSLLSESIIDDESLFSQFTRDYSFYKAKFGLVPMRREQWKTGRLRPSNLPWVRIDQLAYILCNATHLISKFVENPTLDYMRAQLKDIKAVHFGGLRLGKSSIDSIIINAIAPILFIYGRSHTDSRLEEKATAILQEMPAESNSIVEGWRSYGVDASSAFESQALIQLKGEYCERKDCLRCRLFWSMRKGFAAGKEKS